MSRISKVAATLLLVAALAATVSAVVFSSFTSTTKNTGNTFQAGSIALSANTPGSAIFGMVGLKPGDTQSKCIRVGIAAAGGLVSSVRLYGKTTGSTANSGLDRFLRLRVTRGAFPGAAPSDNACTGFTPDATQPLLFDDTLSAYPATYATGIADTSASWRDNDNAVYRLEVTTLDDDLAQGLDAATEFDFEARTN